MSIRDKSWLVTHTNSDGKSGVACARLTAPSALKALALFGQRYPGRVAGVIAEKGVGA